MAEDFAIGRALVIPKDVLSNLDEVDKKINKIATDSENMATKFTSAMSKMSTGTGDLLKRLTEMQTKINNIDMSKFAQGVTNVSQGVSQIEQFSKAITKAAAAINKYNSSQVKKTNVDNTKEINKLNKEIEALKKKTEQLEQYRQKQQQVNREQNSTRTNTKAIDAYNRAMASSEAIVTQRINKIAKLRQAEEMLTKASGDYSVQIKRIRQEIERLNKLNQGQVDAYGRIIKSQRNLMDTSGQLARQLALVFSVSQIEGYIMKLVKVRGEFELQNTALASILQNKDQADKLFGQITELAVKSPFTVKGLTTYTKSLAAYSVEYEKLYNTTKMLADVSAGLGVDMQRLILAFGQVKAANFLRGTETRQFTEAGINMLGELAKYYTELEGRIVSVTEVQDRQFKRMISFQDVEAVFKRLTSAGGMFYNMQERQAETLAGMMSNLQDRIDLMLNSIGKENEGVIKGVIKILANLIENYEAVANAIEAIGVSFLAYKGYLLLTNKELIRFASLSGIVTSSAAKQLTVGQLLQVGFLKLSKSIKSASLAMKSFATSNIYLLAITAIATAIYEAVHWSDEYNEKLEEINKKHSQASANLNKIASEYDDISKKAREAASAQEEFAYSGDTYKKLYSQLSKLNDELKNRGYTLPIQLEFVNPKNIDEAFQGGKELLDYANEFSTEFKKALATETNATEGWFGIFGENLATDLKQLSDSYSEVGSAFKANLDIVENEVINISSKLTGAAREYYNELREGKKEEETNTEWTLRRLELLQKINQATAYWGENRRFNSILKSNEILNDLYKQRVNISNREKEVQYELDKVLNSLIEKYGSLENLKKAVGDNPVIIKTEIDRVFEEMELGEQAKRFASFWASQRLKIPVEFTTPKELPTFYGDFRDTVKTIDTSGIFDKQLESMTSLVDLEEALQKKYQEVSKQQEVLNRANTERLDLTKQIAAEQEKLLSADADEANAAQLKIQNLEKQKNVIDKTISDAKVANEEIIKIIKSIAEAFNLSFLSQKSNGVDNALQRLKDQIALIKKANEEYEKLRQYNSKEEATRIVRESFGDAFKNLGLDIDMTFDTTGIINGLESLYKSVGDKGKKILDESLAPIRTQQEIEIKAKGVEKIQEQIDDLFAGYDLSVELDKMGLDKNLISRLFDVNTFTLDDVRKNLDKLKAEIGDAGLKYEEVFQKAEEKITEMQERELEERLKRYASNLEKSVDKINNIKVKAGVDIQYAGSLFSEGKIDANQYANILKEIIAEMNEEIGKINVNKFKESSEYIKAMGDLSLYSKNELAKLAQQIQNLISESSGKMNASDLKVYQDVLDKINDRIREIDSPFKNNPISEFKELVRIQKEFNEEKKRYNELLEKRNELEIKLELAKIQLAELKKRQEESPSQDFSSDISNTQNNIKDIISQIGSMNNQLNTSQGIMSNLSSQAGGQLDNQQIAMAKIDKIIKSVYQTINSIVEQFEELKELAETFGAETDEGVWDRLSKSFSAISEMNENVMSSWESYKSGDYVGASVKAVSAIFSVVKGINRIIDSKKEDIIRRQIELVENLQEAYEDLEKAIDKAYSIDTYKKASDQAIENLEQQNEALQAAINAERDKKDTDKERIEEWEDQMKDNEEAIAQIIEDRISTVTAGILDDGLSAADAFVDAWLEAFQETGDGLQGLEDNFNEMLLNMIKRQAAMSIVAPLIENMQKELEKYINKDDTDLTISEAEKFAEYVKNQLPEVSAALENLFNGLKDVGLEFGDAGDTMSSLQRGISSVSEETAQALEALLNSMRFYVSDSNTVLHNIYNAIAMPNVENPFLMELKVQSEQLRLLYGLFNGIIKNVSGSGRAMNVRIV